MQKYYCHLNSRNNFIIFHLDLDLHTDNAGISYWRPARHVPRRIGRIYIPWSMQSTKVFDTMLEAEAYCKSQEQVVRNKAIESVEQIIEYNQKKLDKLNNHIPKVKFINTIK